MYAFGFSLNLLTILAIVLSVGLVVDDAIVVVENVERHVREGQIADRRGAGGRARAGGADHRHDDHAGDGLHADRVPGRPHRLAVPRVRDHAGRGGRGVGRRRGHAVAGDELEVRPRRTARKAGSRGWSTAAFEAVRRSLRPAARRRAPDARGHRRRRAAGDGRGVAALQLLPPRARAGRGPEPHQPSSCEAAPDASLPASNRASLDVVRRVQAFPEAELHVVADGPVGRLRRHGHEGLARSARARPSRCTARCTARSRRCPGVRVFPRLDPPLPTPGQYDVELVLRERRAARAAARDGGPGGRRRLAERQVPVRGHRPQDRSARGPGGDRPRAGGRPRARPGERRPGARHAARRRRTSTGSTSTTGATR